MQYSTHLSDVQTLYADWRIGLLDRGISFIAQATTCLCFHAIYCIYRLIYFRGLNERLSVVYSK